MNSIKNLPGLKTGAVICKKCDAENGTTYEALLFISNIPAEENDDDLKAKINLYALNVDTSSCHEILFRADIHPTSNEVQEQYEHSHPGDKVVPEISFSVLSEPLCF